MAKLSAILMITAVFTLFSSAAGSGGKDNPPVACSGSTAECLIDGGREEFLATAAINGGVLTTTKYRGNAPYISYGALAGDSVPCARRGASYYNCRAGAEDNPYDRGCSAISRCRGGGI